MAKILQVVERNKANTGYRILNYLIDFFFSVLIIWVLVLVFVLAKYFIAGADIEQSANEIANIDPLIDRVFTLVIYALIVFLMEKFTNGRTLGKLITGTKVVKTDGSQLTTDDLLKRNFSRIVPFDQLSFLGNNGWHDRWSDTRVVRVKDYEHALSLEKDLQNIGLQENL